MILAVVQVLARGWDVIAVDAQAEALERLSIRVSEGQHQRFTTLLQTRFETLEVPKCQLINASFSLPFCEPSSFTLWHSISTALRPNGLLAGQLFGPRDS
ncbi:hypothetical protein [Pseudomonas sp. LTJR-52]|uniref:hypothetical protein n=1 Tax=Pseudomonas sp. LTJR-52 TaxID=2479392 RepID=UPI0021146D37|nr:hypothetical protein [Pseudomonas sp. LTJR-52]